MPSTVYLHIGTPKSGTTYLQQVLAANRETLREQGLLYPGSGPDHFLAAQDVLGHAFRGHADESVEGAWADLLGEVADWPQRVLISHELLCLAGEEQVDRIVREMPGDVEVLLTARDLMRQLPAVWQETVKNGSTLTLTEFVDKVRLSAPTAGGPNRFWALQDLRRILTTWEQRIPSAKITIITVPPSGSNPLTLWQRFAQALSIELPAEAMRIDTSNVSLGAPEAEFVRRLNERVFVNLGWPEYRARVKRFLVHRVLSKNPSGVPIAVSDTDAVWAVERAASVVGDLTEKNYTIIGDVQELLPTAPNAFAAAPGIDDADVVDIGVNAVTGALRRIAREHRALSRTSRESS